MLMKFYGGVKNDPKTNHLSSGADPVQDLGSDGVLPTLDPGNLTTNFLMI